MFQFLLALEAIKVIFVNTYVITVTHSVTLSEVKKIEFRDVIEFFTQKGLPRQNIKHRLHETETGILRKLQTTALVEELALKD